MIAVVKLGMQQICCYNRDGSENISRIWTVCYLTLIQKLGRGGGKKHDETSHIHKHKKLAYIIT